MPNCHQRGGFLDGGGEQMSLTGDRHMNLGIRKWCWRVGILPSHNTMVNASASAHVNFHSSPAREGLQGSMAPVFRWLFNVGYATLILLFDFQQV